jgi:hypothetical protein
MRLQNRSCGAIERSNCGYLGALMELVWGIILSAFQEFEGQYQASCTTITI